MKRHLALHQVRRHLEGDRRDLLLRLLQTLAILPLAELDHVAAAQFARSETWGNQGTFPAGREFAARSVRELLKAHGLPSILQYNEAQQVLIEAWSIITCFSLFQDFKSCPGGRDGWKSMLYDEVEKLQGLAMRPSSDAYAAINNILLPALGDRSALHLLPQVLEEAEEISEGAQVVGLGVAFVQPPSPSPGLRPRLKVLTVVPGSLAAKAGIRYGDRLVSIDGQDVGGLQGRDPGLMIPGPVGSKVDAVFERESQAIKGREKSAGRQLETVSAVLERQFMAADVVSFQWLRALSGARAVPVAYLSVLSFAGPPVAKPASSLLGPLRNTQPPPPLILDLRGNAGGSLSEAQALGDVIAQASSNLVILADRDTASASEALILALQAASREACVLVAPLPRASRAWCLVECTPDTAIPPRDRWGRSDWSASGAARLRHSVKARLSLDSNSATARPFF